MTFQCSSASCVRRVVDAVHPTRIVLFGSAARGEMHAHSDLDVLIVVPDGTHRRQTAALLSRVHFDLGAPKEIVVTEGDVRQYRDEASLVMLPALAEGRELYRAA